MSMYTYFIDDMSLSQKSNCHEITRLGRTIALALFFALTVVTLCATPVFAQGPNILVDDHISVPKNGSAEVELLGNDTLPDFAFFDFTRPENGSFTFTSNALRKYLSVDYTPNRNYVGSDSFVYSIIDSLGNATHATVHIRVYADLDCSTCLLRHAATPVNVTIGDDGAFNYKFIGDEGVSSGPVLPPVEKLAEMHAPGSGNVVLFSGANSVSGAQVIISYLSDEQVVHVNTSYMDRHNGTMKPYIFVINLNHEVSHWEW